MIHSKKLPKKIDALIDIILSNTNGKFLIFSEYDNTFRDIENRLKEKNISWNNVKGSGARIKNIINDFNNGKTKILLLNAKYNGAGLNLEQTTDIIIYHRMSAELEKQIIGRGQRFGRTKALNIYYLCYDNES